MVTTMETEVKELLQMKAESIDQPRPNTRSCNSCQINDSKYRCPGCGVSSCSLDCVKKHKAETSCNGLRKKTDFVSVQKFNEIHLTSDYRFLEDCAREADNAIRDGRNRSIQLSKRCMLFRTNAKRFNCHVSLMPVGMSKRMQNSSFYNIKEKCIYWTVSWIFPDCNASYVDKRVNDGLTLETILKKYTDPIEMDPVHRPILNPYAVKGLDQCHILLCQQMKPHRYFELKMSQTLRQALSGKQIIEFPEIHIVFDKSKHSLMDKQEAGTSSSNEKEMPLIREQSVLSNSAEPEISTMDDLSAVDASENICLPILDALIPALIADTGQTDE